MTSVAKANFIRRVSGGFEHVINEPDKWPINYLMLSDNSPVQTEMFGQGVNEKLHWREL